ncbi:MAG: hypothetical protein A2W19_05145 [Spirochaetes bacterium RBG_16_49_21]|nr:MAG: hypothetical protein A2W19_05145 [Spirochaetes bacterium RBG_16_49_21]
MNQDQVKQKLFLLDGNAGDFSVIFTGKKSRKVDGLYYPDRKEIIIHNRNFSNDDQLIYTAIHEFAHHLQHVRSVEPISTRAHTVRFWDIFHKLLYAAEEKGVYANIFKRDGRFTALTRTIREKFLSANGNLMKELGKLLAQAHDLCREHNASFDDYVDRELLLHRTAAKLLMKIHSFDIRPDIGYENMKTVASIRDDEIRSRAEEAFAQGKTSDMVKAEFIARNRPDQTLDVLVQERDRIERSIDTLSRKLAKIEKKINEIKYNSKT